MASARPTDVAAVDRLISVDPDELRFNYNQTLEKPRVLLLMCLLDLVTNPVNRCSESCNCTDFPVDIFLSIQVELDKQSFCDLKVVNITEQLVAFKVKTTSPRKYFVRPNSSVIQPQEECFVRVTLQAQREYPPDMQCRDKFLLQSTAVPRDTDLVENSQDVFNKDGGRVVEEIKLKVVYVYTNSEEDSQGDNLGGSIDNGPDNDLINVDRDLQRLKTQRDTAIQQVQLLEKDIELLKKQRYQRKPYGFSILAALMVGLIGILVGLALSFLLAPPRHA